MKKMPVPSMRSPRNSRRLLCLLTLCSALYTVPAAQAAAAAAVNTIIAAEAAPPGVVFDIDEWDIDALKHIIARVRDYVDRLRTRFPGLAIVVVSHGEEEFSLMKRAAKNFPQLHHNVEALVADSVPVHVCAGHAVMSGYSENEFVEFVDKVPAGVEKVAEYRRKGFLHIPVLSY